MRRNRAPRAALPLRCRLAAGRPQGQPPAARVVPGRSGSGGVLFSTCPLRVLYARRDKAVGWSGV
eukprot:scaffold2124_cov90-Isochrysis_galbana.AAC.3